MEFKDYYKIMGVSPTASTDEIKRAYRKLARKYHPDVSKEANAEQHFKEVGEAYEVLKDPKKKAQYDQIREGGWQAGDPFKGGAPFEQGRGHRSGAHQQNAHFEEVYEGGDFSDFFTSIFGFQNRAAHTEHASRRRQPIPREDIHYRLPVTLQEAYSGAKRTIELMLAEWVNGQLVQRAKKLNVKIPAGIVAGQAMRLRGQGGKSQPNAEPGDIYLEISFEPHPYYTVNGRDIYLNLPITPWEAALGSKLTVPTLGGDVQLKIPEGAVSGQKLRLSKRGLPGDPPGDQYVILAIVVPPAKTPEDKALYEKMAETMAFNPRSHLPL